MSENSRFSAVRIDENLEALKLVARNACKDNPENMFAKKLHMIATIMQMAEFSDDQDHREALHKIVKDTIENGWDLDIGYTVE